MKKIINLLVIICFSLQVFAEDVSHIDSLVRDLEKNPSFKTANQISFALKDIVSPRYYFSAEDKLDLIMAGTYAEYSQYLYKINDSRGVLFAKKGFEISQSIHNDSILAECANNLSIAYQRLGIYSSAIIYAKVCLDVDRRYKNKFNLSVSLNNIASLYYSEGQMKTAEKYIVEAIDNIGDSNEPAILRSKSNTLGSASMIYAALNQLEKGYEYARKAYEIDSVINNSEGMASRMHQMAIILRKMGNEEKAKLYLNKSLDILHENEIKNDILIASLYGLNRYREALDVAREIQNVNYQYRMLVSLAKTSKDIDEIKAYAEEAFSLRDSLASIDYRNSLERFNLEYQEKDNIIEQQQAKIEQQQSNSLRVMFIALVFLLLVVVSVIGWIRAYRNKNKLSQNYNLQKHTNDVKDRLIRVMSHDLSGASINISMIAGLLREKYKEDSLTDLMMKQSDSLKSFLDNLLIWARMQRTGSSKVCKARMSLDDYVDDFVNRNQHLVAAKNISLKGHRECDSACNIDADRNVLNCIMRNLLGNAIKFTENGGEITIGYDDSHISVIDNGVGIAPNDIKALLDGSRMVYSQGTNGELGTGLGMSIIRDMIEMSETHLEIISEVGKGSEFRIIF